jgi:hypothetical protein
VVKIFELYDYNENLVDKKEIKPYMQKMFLLMQYGNLGVLGQVNEVEPNFGQF